MEQRQVAKADITRLQGGLAGWQLQRRPSMGQLLRPSVGMGLVHSKQSVRKQSVRIAKQLYA